MCRSNLAPKRQCASSDSQVQVFTKFLNVSGMESKVANQKQLCLRLCPRNMPAAPQSYRAACGHCCDGLSTHCNFLKSKSFTFPNELLNETSNYIDMENNIQETCNDARHCKKHSIFYKNMQKNVVYVEYIKVVYFACMQIICETRETLPRSLLMDFINPYFIKVVS